MPYADDLILLAESEQDLQTQINSLGTYADIFQMEVNQKKTKVLVFDKPAKLKKNVLRKRGQQVTLTLEKIKFSNI